MKVETPQLRWHQIVNPQSQKDAGANGPILSCSLLSLDDATGVLATAGNTEVNLWRVGFTDDAARSSSACAAEEEDGTPRSSARILVQPHTTAAPPLQRGDHTRIEHVATLSRGTNERGVNAVKFSPTGAHLVAAGDGGTVAVWAAPAPASPGTTSPASRWAGLGRETDAPVRILFNQSDDIMDVAWSADARRFAVCSLDHTVAVWERAADGEWRSVHRAAKDHTHYVQGVAYDPRGVYLASMGSDRMVKVYARKHVKDAAVRDNVKDAAVREGLGNHQAVKGATAATPAGEEQEQLLRARVLPDLLAAAPFALQGKVRTLKFLDARPAAAEADPEPAPGATTATTTPASPVAKRHHMFADELTLGSFFRRPAFTPDGAFLVVPAALWHGPAGGRAEAPGSPTSVAADRPAARSFATYLFARHRFDRPYKVLAGLEKPSVVVRPNPVLFRLPPTDPAAEATPLPAPLPYRSVFAVLTADTVLLYDTHHDHPLALARGLHYAGLTDAAWSADGRTLFVTSSDGYVSVLSFAKGELGDPWEADGVVGGAVAEYEGGVAMASDNKLDPAAVATADADGSGERRTVTFATPTDDRSNPPVSDLPVVNMLVPKRKKKKIVPTLVAPASSQEHQCREDGGASSPRANKRATEDPAPLSTDAPQEAPINILVPKKKKKAASSSTPVAIA